MTARHLLMLALLTLVVGCGEGAETDPEAPAPRTTVPVITSAANVARKDRPACEALRESDVAAIVMQTSRRELDKIGPVDVERNDSKQTSSCGYYAGPHDDVAVKLTIDRANQSQKRYWYRLEEQNQRNLPDSDLDPRLIRGVGQDKTYGGAGAFWVPSLAKLVAWRDDRLLTVIFFVPGVMDREASAAAASLAKTAYTRLFGNKPPAPVKSLAGRDPHP